MKDRVADYSRFPSACAGGEAVTEEHGPRSGGVMADRLPEDFPQLLDDVRASTSGLIRSVDPLAEGGDARRLSLMAGWTLGHVLTHLARNADAMVRTLDGALRDEPTPMYPQGARGRDADIQAGAKRSMAEIVVDLRVAVQRLDDAWNAMTPSAWNSDAIIRSGRLPAWKTVWARWSEVEIHWVNLDIGHGPDAWPERFVRQMMQSLLEPSIIGRSLTDRLPKGIRLELFSIENTEHWSAGLERSRTIGVHGPRWALASWLTGRLEPARPALEVTGGAELPWLTPWW